MNHSIRPEGERRGHRLGLSSGIFVMLLGAGLVAYAGRKWKFAAEGENLVPLKLLVGIGTFFTVASIASIGIGCRVRYTPARHLVKPGWTIAKFLNKK